MQRAILALVLVGGCGDKRTDTPPAAASGPATPAPAAAPSTTVSIAGTVIDRDTREPVGDVEVVLRGHLGEVSTRSRADGTFAVVIARGDYRAFVRDPRVITTGFEGRSRLRSTARADLAGAADEMLMPLIELDADTRAIELAVTAAAVISGVVTDPDGEPVENVAIHAVALESISTGTRPRVGTPIIRRAAPRPALGTDTVISDASGRFVLRVPAGRYELAADHPQYAGVAGLAEVELDAGARHDAMLTLARGCIVSGKVIGPHGKPPNDGAIEVLSDLSRFGPAERIRPDGTFRWTTTSAETVSIRAWPWQSPPSPAQLFTCRDGKRYPNIVLHAGNSLPDLAGTIVDADGNPVPLAYLDIHSLDSGSNNQQERADASGVWHVYDLPPGRYDIKAHAPGRGVISTMAVAPRSDVALQLSGAGRLAGTTTELVDGSFELTFHHCGPAADPFDIDEDTRIVIVRGGRFSVDRVPACALTFSARWRDRVIEDHAVIEPGRTAYVELALGTGRDKSVRGSVRDKSGNPVANARVTALVDNQEAGTARTDSAGTFTLTTQSGAQIVAGNGKQVGRASVGRANVASEQVDVVLDVAVDDDF